MEVATMLSEVDRRIAEAKKDMYEFKRDIIGTTALCWLDASGCKNFPSACLPPVLMLPTLA